MNECGCNELKLINLFNPLGPRILLKHPFVPGFMAFLERFYFCVKKSVEKNLFNIDNYKLCLFEEY